jgi:hypothetical protein
VQKATAGPLLYHDERITHAITADWHPWLKLLTPEQLQRRAASEPDVTGPHVLDVHNKPFQPAKSSSVVLMGDSFCTALNYLLGPGAGLDAEISRRINMPVALWQVDGGTVQTIKDVARDPEMLKGVKVIVWVMQDQSVCNPTAWRLPPLPPPATSATGARGRS